MPLAQGTGFVSNLSRFPQSGDETGEPSGSLAARHAASLLGLLGASPPPAPLIDADHPALAWRRAGLMTVTGPAAGPALVAPVALTCAADGALAALRALAPGSALPESGAVLLGERARLLGLSRGGRSSANGSCRLIAARGGDLALNLARDDDRDLLAAWLETDLAGGWPEVAALAASRDRDRLVDRGRLLGLAVAADDEAARQEAGSGPFHIVRHAGPRRPGPPLVVDFSSLWAGPLAGSLLASAGARVIKVESRARPDGARAGEPRFYDLLNAGKESVALDFSRGEDLAVLHRLVSAADMVIEASRPRALRQLGLDAEAFARGGGVWLSITAHGREGAASEWIGLGDDVAVAAGLSAAMRRGWGEALFAGDAIADPLTGITAALAAWHEWQRGGGSLVSVPMRGVAAHALALFEAGPELVRQWQALAQADTAPLAPLRQAPSPARAPGEDNPVLASLLRG